MTRESMSPHAIALFLLFSAQFVVGSKALLSL
jgi:hypothetical protein